MLKNKKINVLRIGLTVILISIFVANIVSIFWSGADQFNLFCKYDTVYRLLTWNIPDTVFVDIDQDGIKDRITFTGCLTFSGSLDSKPASEEYYCEGNNNKSLKIYDLEKRPGRGVILAYAARTKNGQWDIVLVNNLKTELYNINNQRKVYQRKPPISLQADSMLYFLSHLFVLALK